MSMDKHSRLLAIAAMILETWERNKSVGDDTLIEQIARLERQRDHLMREIGIDVPPRSPEVRDPAIHDYVALLRARLIQARDSMSVLDPLHNQIDEALRAHPDLKNGAHA